MIRVLRKAPASIRYCQSCFRDGGWSALTLGKKNGKCENCGEKLLGQVPSDSKKLLEIIKKIVAQAAKENCGPCGPHGHQPYHSYGIMFNGAGAVGCRCLHSAGEALAMITNLLFGPPTDKAIEDLERQMG